MDLLERGRSLSELGRTLRWTDIEAMLLHLPATSHVSRALSPEAAREAARIEGWTSPTVSMLGLFFDAWERNELLRRGVPAEKLPEQGVISRILSPEEAEKKSSEAAVKPVRPKRSAAEIRQMVKDREV